MAKVRFVRSSAGIRAMLQSEEVGKALEAAARKAAPPDTIVSRVVGRSRQNIRIADESPDGLDREAKTGHLTRALGQVQI